MSTFAGNRAAGVSSICNIRDDNEECRFGHEDSEHALIDTEDIDPNASCEQVPKVGLTFESEDAAYKFYNSYARKTGFSVRKCHTKHRADGTLASKYMVCSNEGPKTSNPKQQPKKERASTMSECKARVQFYVSREGIWKMQKVVLDHSHSFTSPDKIHMLRSQWHMLPTDEHIIGTEIFEFFQLWSGGAENVHFLQMDCNNFIGRQRKKYLESNDAKTLLEYLANKQAEDPSFFYTMELDEEDSGRICNFFWADGQAIADYACFGDVICFDTTFQTNKAEMPFAPIIGTNHHRQTIVFGAALLFNESSESFECLFKSFLRAMSGKTPETIFTDQCAAIAKAIIKVFPTSSHRLCLWHIYQNAGKHLSNVIANHPDFLKDFKNCVYEEKSVGHFNLRWQELIATYNLEENAWIQNLYNLREYWAAVFRNDSFCADMTSTQRSEGMNNVFKKSFRRKLSISKILVEYDKCIARLRRNELLEHHRSRSSDPILCITTLPLLKTPSESYTRNMYSAFQEQFQKQFTLSSTLINNEDTISLYKVMAMDNSEDEARVIFNSDDKNVSCSCKKYISLGILCKHVLRVFNQNDIFDLPPQYILNRWTKYAKRGIYTCRTQSQSGSLASQSTNLCRKMISVTLKCATSKEVMQQLENGFDKLTLEVENLLGKVELDENEAPHCFLECTEEVAKERISFRAPPHKKGPREKRLRNALEKGKKNPPRETTTRGEDPTPSSDAKAPGVPQIIEEPQDSNVTSYDNTLSVTNTMMPFGHMPMFFPPIRGELTNLLLGVHHEAATTSRRLDFDEDFASKSTN